MPKSTQRSRRTKASDQDAKGRADATMQDLRRRLAEAEEILEAIRGGHADAVVVAGPQGDQVYTLKDAARPYQIVIDQINEGAVTLNRDGLVLYANERTAGLLRLPLERILGESFVRLVHPSDEQAARRLVELAQSGPCKGELSLSLDGGESLPVLVSMRHVVLDGDSRISAIITDISERKQAEEQVRRYAGELEQRVAERTAQLQDSLEQEHAVRIALEATNKELEAFTYTVSHDFRGPLNQIDELARVLLDDYATQLPDSGQQLAQLIHSHAAALNCLAEDLLTLTRVSQQPVQKTRVDMGKLVRDVLAELGPVQDGRSVEISIGDLPPAMADPVLVRQVWLNLLSNSLKFTRIRESARIQVGSWKPDSGESPTFDFHPRAPHSKSVIYYVRDNGAGFDAAQSERLFRAFQRLHHSEEFEGSGLGLAIVERIVRRHGGRVGAEGDIDRGAIFWFTLES